MKLYGYEVNACNYKQFSTGQLDEFRSMLKSNIRNFHELVEPTIEAMIDESKADNGSKTIQRLWLRGLVQEWECGTAKYRLRT